MIFEEQNSTYSDDGTIDRGGLGNGDGFGG